MATANIYEEILTNIDAEKKAWCQFDFEVRKYNDEKEEHEGPVLSRCLVGHIDYATGVAYTKANGKQFRSLSPKKWRRRNEILRHLVAVMTPKMRERADESYLERLGTIDAEEENARIREFIAAAKANELDDSERVNSPEQSAVISFNDNSRTRKQNVKALLKRAAKLHPED